MAARPTKINLPKDVPARDFWSFTLYDNPASRLALLAEEVSQNDRLLTIAEAAELLGCGRRTLDQMGNDRRIPAHLIGGRVVSINSITGITVNGQGVADQRQIGFRTPFWPCDR